MTRSLSSLSIGISLWLSLVLAAPGASPRVELAQPASKEFSRENLRKTLESARRRGYELQADLEQAQNERRVAVSQLKEALLANFDLQADAVKQETGIKNLRDWGVAQQTRAEKLERDLLAMTGSRDKWRKLSLTQSAAIALVLLVVAVLAYFKFK